MEAKIIFSQEFNEELKNILSNIDNVSVKTDIFSNIVEETLLLKQ